MGEVVCFFLCVVMEVMKKRVVYLFFSVLFIYSLRRMGWRSVRENDVKKTA